jgi:hypothetical protein
LTKEFVPKLIDLERAELPTLLKQFSWTLAAPFKEERHHRLISDSIGNNFTPSAADLCMKQFQKRLAIPLGIIQLIRTIICKETKSNWSRTRKNERLSEFTSNVPKGKNRKN